MKYKPKPSGSCLCNSNPLIYLFAVALALSFLPVAHADIYRFVTVDGVETFTDTPNSKEAKIVIKDKSVSSSKHRKTSKHQKTHDISLNEVVEKAVSASLAPAEAFQDSFEPHLPEVGGTITSKVGMRIDPIDGVWRQHNGIDISIPTGTQVKPVASGVVVYSGSRSGYGNTVIVEHDNGVITLYAHNSRLLVTEGQPVATETVLALSGSTGRSTGPHLHFEAWQSGTNITTAFLPDSGIRIPKTTVVARNHGTSRFRSETLSDGSILFTNIPATTP
ncbi:MAG: peptidoglycan DD-metalloendopeptidase family protein [Geobacter sp.]|nr:peptidoglycan DD-metalloendopeptidase family protein [Geobacter sp.]